MAEEKRLWKGKQVKTIAQALKIGDNIKSINFSYFADIEAIFGHLGPFLATFGLFLPKTQNWSCDHSKQSEDEQKSDGDGLRCHFPDV